MVFIKYGSKKITGSLGVKFNLKKFENFSKTEFQTLKLLWQKRKQEKLQRRQKRQRKQRNQKKDNFFKTVRLKRTVFFIYFYAMIFL